MRLGIGLLVSLAPVVATTSTAAAQAWVSDKGELSLSLRSDFQTASGTFHGDDGLITGLPTRAVNSLFTVEYVPISKLSTALTLNANGATYQGPLTQPGANFALAHGSQDDGSWHWNITDLDFYTRYQAYDGPVTLTPVLHLRTPVTDYENRGYAAAGMHLREAGLGLSLGKYGVGTEDLVLQASYMFTVPAKEHGGGAATEQYRTIRSDFDVSLAYIFSPSFVAAAGVAVRVTHDGFELEDYDELPSGDPLIDWHDPVLKQMYIAPSVLASYQVTPSFSLAGNFAIIAHGDGVSNAITFGLTAGFSTNLGGGADADASGDAAITTE